MHNRWFRFSQERGLFGAFNPDEEYAWRSSQNVTDVTASVSLVIEIPYWCST